MITGIAMLCLYAFVLRRRVVQMRAKFLAHAPMKLLFLWVFGGFERLNSLFLGLGALWRCIGSLQLLRGSTFLATSNEILSRLGKRDGRLLASTPQEAAALIARFPHQPHRWMCMYSTNSLLCRDESWRQAFHMLLKETDAVLMDLSGSHLRIEVVAMNWSVC